MARDEEQQPAPSTARSAPRAYCSPRYSVFLLTGAVLGAVAGLALAVLGAAPTASGGAGALGYFAALGALVGVLLAGTVAVVVESVANRGRPRR